MGRRVKNDYTTKEKSMNTIEEIITSIPGLHLSSCFFNIDQCNDMLNESLAIHEKILKKRAENPFGKRMKKCRNFC